MEITTLSLLGESILVWFEEDDKYGLTFYESDSPASGPAGGYHRISGLLSLDEAVQLAREQLGRHAQSQIRVHTPK